MILRASKLLIEMKSQLEKLKELYAMWSKKNVKGILIGVVGPRRWVRVVNKRVERVAAKLKIYFCNDKT